VEQNYTPGPGAYSIHSGNFDINSSSNLLGTMSDIETAFGSTAERPCLAATKTSSLVGPGAYGDSRTFSALTQNINKKSTVGARGVFSTTAPRFMPGELLDGTKIANTPGVGQYKIKKSRFQRSREGSSFRSSSKRCARPATGLPQYVMVGETSTPAPGAYFPERSTAIGSVTASKGQHRKPKKTQFGEDLSFGATETRLRSDQIFGKSIDKSSPAPGTYSSNSESLAGKLATARRFTSADATGCGFGGSSTRFRKSHNVVDSYGVGLDQNSMIKKSFNKKAGYKSAKVPDQRIKRAHTAYLSGSGIFASNI